jgi:hypothetical protein
MIEGSQRGPAEPSGRRRERVADIPLLRDGLTRLAPGEPIRDSARVHAPLVDRAQGAVELSVDVRERGPGRTLPAWLRSAARGALRLASAA